MKPSRKYYFLLFVAVAAFFTASKLMFDEVNNNIRVVIDEQFHIPQGLAYCYRNFSYWGPKIATLPGLYLASAAFLGSYFDCSIYNLRFINLVASTGNLLLFASILKFIYGSNETAAKIVLQALNLAMLPPLYFFSHVYYTDTLSMTFVLSFYRLCFVNKSKKLILIFSVYSVLMRQTNIVWIALVFGHKVLDIMIKSSRVFGNQYLTKARLSKNSIIAKDIDSSKLKRYYTLTDVFIALKYHLLTCFTTFFKFLTYQDALLLMTHGIVLILFMVFVAINGSIVVGDKEAHEATLHIPQLFYFLLFYGVFALPCVIAKVPSTLRLMLRNKRRIVLFAIIMCIIVHFNAEIHPYLLADNRHFTFYIWNRWFGKYDYAIYATVPIYIFLLFSLYDNLKDQNCISFLLPYTICLFTVLAFQKMIEVRYFLIPFITLRLRFVKPSFKVTVFEFLWYVALNVAAFYVFFNRIVMWREFNYVQRIIW